MGNGKRTFVVALLMALVTTIAGPATAEEALDKAERMVITKTGRLGDEIPVHGADLPGMKVKPAKGLRTWLQRDNAGLRLIAQLDEGQSEGTFEDLIPEHWVFEHEADGSLRILDEDRRLQGRVEAPWAVDADGRGLPTHYEVRGQDLRQEVDTHGASFPVVMDPTVTTGWWYVTPVYYIKYDWSGTWKLKNYIDDNRTLIAALVCNFIPNNVARTTCQALFILVRTDVINTVNAAIAARKCFKVRMPATGGALALPAYDSYYVAC